MASNVTRLEHALWLAVDDTTSDDPDLFGVHIPELQLDDDAYRRGMEAAGLSAGDTYLELGCGHGRGLVIAAREFGAVATGVEYLPDAIARAHARARSAGVEVAIQRGDVRASELAADVIHMHLGPAFHDVLASRFERLLCGSGARVIAARWGVPGWIPCATTPLDDSFVYRPGDPATHGVWDTDPGARKLMWRAGADLIDVEVHVHPPDGAAPIELARCDLLARGQSLTVTAPAECAGSVAVTGTGRDGETSERGTRLEL